MLSMFCWIVCWVLCVRAMHPDVLSHARPRNCRALPWCRIFVTWPPRAIRIPSSNHEHTQSDPTRKSFLNPLCASLLHGFFSLNFATFVKIRLLALKVGRTSDSWTAWTCRPVFWVCETFWKVYRFTFCCSTWCRPGSLLEVREMSIAFYRKNSTKSFWLMFLYMFLHAWVTSMIRSIFVAITPWARVVWPVGT